jgi:hypothetical protein
MLKDEIEKNQLKKNLRNRLELISQIFNLSHKPR